MKMRKELNNKGFSLVELLIATIILGIVVAPLLHTFVTAANTTARSRQIGDATLAGENIAEKVEAGSIDDLKNGRIFPGATVTTADGCYYVTIPSVAAGSSAFAAKVTLDPSAYHKNAGETVDRLNDVLMADYSEMDGIYAQDLDVRNPDVMAYFDFTTAANAKHLGAAAGEDAGEGSGEQEGEQAITKEVWLPSTVEPVRTMTLDITEDSNGYIHAILQIRYAYDYLYDKINLATGDSTRYSGHIKVGPYPYDLMSAGFLPTSEGGRLPNLYMMYYPLYESGKINDIIYINNNVAEPIKIFLVKEKMDDPSVDIKEDAYNATVVQNVPAGTRRENYAVVYSNIREDLVDGHDLMNQITYEIRRGLLFSDRGYFGGDNGDLVSKSAGDRMYDVTVEIFDTGFTTPIHTSYSTKLK